MNATAPARSAGGTMETTNACRAGTSICERLKRASNSPIAQGSEGLSGTSSRKRLLGTWVKTMVRIKPIRLASRPESSYEAACSSAMPAKAGPRTLAPAPNRTWSQ